MTKWLISRGEFRGAFVLLLLILLVLVGNLLMEKYAFWKPQPVKVAEKRPDLDSMLLALEEEKREAFIHDSTHYALGWKKKEPEDKPLALHSFDPNTVSREDWVAMNLPERVFNGLEKWRSKGGRIRQAEQIRKLYNLKPEVAEALIPYIQLDTASLAKDRKSFIKPFPKFEPREKPKPFDLNLADTIQLMGVYGIGRGLANRIVRHRNGLGGFLNKEQLYDVFGLDSSVVDELFVKAYIAPNPTITPLAINTITEDELAKNPILRRGLARIVIKYRTQHGPFKKPEDLLEIKIIKPEMVEKLRPYLTF